MTALNWTCPFCNTRQLSSNVNRHYEVGRIPIGVNRHGNCGYNLSATACLNPDCQEVTIDFWFRKIDAGPSPTYGEIIFQRRLNPFGNYKPQPSIIPKYIVDNYIEACLIKDLSPKASATLSRRCIQGIIRNFCNISKDTLLAEISELTNQVNNNTAPLGVNHETVEAINAVRKVGNVGAHMEKDVNVIVDLDPAEADQLISLIELLFDEWYVARHSRQEKLNSIKALADSVQARRDQHPDTEK